FVDGFGNVSYYNNQSDNYVQTHFHLIYNRQINMNLYLNAAGHFTVGSGYYEQYREDELLADYGLPSWVFAGVVEIQQTDLIRRKWMSNYFTGAIFNLLYNNNRLDASFGGGVNRYAGDHFGRLIWMRIAGWTEKNHQWYLNSAQKDEFNVYGKINYKIGDRINVFGDLQYRHIFYNITGTDDDLRYLNLLKRFNFFNPKAGVFITINPNQEAYISLGIANREPTRANYKDASGDADAMPMSETLYDIEGGYNIKLAKFHAGVNLYYMIYDDQLVPTGKLSNVGYPIMTNVKDSYRAGVELTAAVKPFEFLAWSGSTTLSRSRIKNFTEYALNYNTSDWSSEEISREHGDVEIAYSPPVIMNSDLELLPGNSVAVHFISKYVARQYFDNTQSESRKINPYFVNSIRLDYRPGLRQIERVDLQLQVNNIFNLQYESNAYGGNWYEDGVEYTWSYYFPQAGINYLLRLSILF
ncbi:MAG: TonB-dependent receptor, partial [Bacteroidales bacterium]|nr:TonB-dependent receptor [Bacteroidales bacterium]